MCIVAEKRQAEAARIRDKYPDRIPVSGPGLPVVPPVWLSCAQACPILQVIVEKAEKSDIPDIDKKK